MPIYLYLFLKLEIKLLTFLNFLRGAPEGEKIMRGMKKFLVLGGSGTMGAEIAHQLVERSDAKIIVAAWAADSKGLEKVARELGNRVSVRVVNVNDFEALVQLMREADLVINSIGPFYKYGAKVVEASINAQVNFLDINDDFDAVEASLSLDKKAKEIGTTAIIGMGGSPGLTNMLAKYGANKMDKVDEIRIFWAESSIDPTGPAAMMHWLHIISGDVPVFKDGNWVNVRGFSEPEVVEFLPPIGKLEVFFTGHPEPVTLPRYIEGVKSVSIKGSLFPPRMMNMYKVLTDLGLGCTDDLIVTEALAIPLRELSVRIIRAMPRFAPGYFEQILKETSELYQSCAAAIKVKVTGNRGREKVQYIYDVITDSVRLTTAVPAAVVALMILGGKVTKKGVLPPEGALDADLFLSEMKKEVRLCETETRVRKI